LAAYSLQFGQLESPEFDEAQWSCIEAAIKGDSPEVVLTHNREVE
jgi:hypothetical protein